MVLDMTTPKKKLPPALAARARAAAAMTPTQRAAWAKKMQAARKAAKKNPPPTRTTADKQWCAVGSNANNYSGKAVYRTFGAGASARAACRAYCAEHDCTAQSLTDDQITAIDTGEGTPAQIRAINARADRRGQIRRGKTNSPPKRAGRAFVDYAPIARTQKPNPPGSEWWKDQHGGPHKTAEDHEADAAERRRQRAENARAARKSKAAKAKTTTKSFAFFWSGNGWQFQTTLQDAFATHASTEDLPFDKRATPLETLIASQPQLPSAAHNAAAWTVVANGNGWRYA